MQRSDAYGSSNGRAACYEIGIDWSSIPHIRGLRFFVCTSVRFLSIAKIEFLFLCLPLPSDVVFVQCALPKGADRGRKELRVLRGPGSHRYLDEQFQATKAENQFASGIIFGAL